MKQFLKWITLLMLLCCFQTVFATPTTPTSDFIDNGDGTVTHKLTGLVWMRCSMGQTWNNATKQCDGTAQTYTWNDAMALKSDFAGKSDWRLPNIWELSTIVERENYNPAINTTIFPSIQPEWLWSSSIHSDYAWGGYFGNGSRYWYKKNELFSVRLVRSGQSFDFLPLITPDNDFIDNQDGTVTHKRTGLVWQRCSVGQTWTGSSCFGTATKYTYDAAMTLKSSFAGKTDWRVPNINELQTIVEYGLYDPAINPTIFPNTLFNTRFWSSSLFAPPPIFYVWSEDFYDGNNQKGDKYVDSYFVRLVRGQWSAPSLNAVPTINLSASEVDVTNTLHFNLSQLTPSGSVTLYRKLLTTDKVYTNTFKANDKGTLALDWYISTLISAGEWQTWVVDDTSNQSSIPQSVQIATNPNISLTANDVNFSPSRKAVKVQFKTTAAVLKNISANIYMGFQLPDGTVLYDDGVKLTRERKPRLANATIATITKYQPALGYNFGAKAVSGAYSYWAIIENATDATILADAEIVLSYCAECVESVAAMKTKPQPSSATLLINAPSAYPKLSVDAELAQNQKIAYSQRVNASRKASSTNANNAPFALFKATVMLKSPDKYAQEVINVLVDKVLGDKSGYDIADGVNKPNDFAQKIKPFIDSLGQTLPDATVNEEQDTAAAIDLLQWIFDKSNSYTLDFSEPVKNFVAFEIAYTDRIAWETTDRPQSTLSIDVQCHKPWYDGLFSGACKGIPTLSIYELGHFECPTIGEKSSCHLVKAGTTTAIFSSEVKNNPYPNHSYPSSGFQSVPMGVYKLVVSYNNQSKYYLCNALHATASCKVYMP